MQLIAGLPDGMSDTTLVKALAARGVQARAVSSFYLGKPRRQGLLLGFAGYTSEAIRRGLDEISDVIPN